MLRKLFDVHLSCYKIYLLFDVHHFNSILCLFLIIILWNQWFVNLLSCNYCHSFCYALYSWIDQYCCYTISYLFIFCFNYIFNFSTFNCYPVHSSIVCLLELLNIEFIAQCLYILEHFDFVHLIIALSTMMWSVIIICNIQFCWRRHHVIHWEYLYLNIFDIH